MFCPYGVTLLGGITLLEKVCHCHCGAVSEILYAQSMPSVAHNVLLLPVGQGVEIPTPSPAVCFHACHHASHHDDNELNLWNINLAKIQCFL